MSFQVFYNRAKIKIQNKNLKLLFNKYLYSVRQATKYLLPGTQNDKIFILWNSERQNIYCRELKTTKYLFLGTQNDKIFIPCEQV